MKPKRLTRDEVDRMVRSASFVQVADWLSTYVVEHHPDRESLRTASSLHVVTISA